MGFVHGKNTYLDVDGNNISAFTNTSTFNRGADIHDVTTYGKDDHVNEGGLGNNSGSMGGIYDNTASTGPRAVLEPRIGTTSVLTRRVEGTGSGKPQDVVDIVITSYVETSPTADMVAWSCEYTCSDSVDSTAQA